MSLLVLIGCFLLGWWSSGVLFMSVYVARRYYRGVRAHGLPYTERQAWQAATPLGWGWEMWALVLLLGPVGWLPIDNAHLKRQRDTTTPPGRS